MKVLYSFDRSGLDSVEDTESYPDSYGQEAETLLTLTLMKVGSHVIVGSRACSVLVTPWPWRGER